MTKALEMLNNAEIILKPFKSEFFIGQVYLWKGMVYYYLKKYDDAEKLFLMADNTCTKNFSAITKNRLGRVRMAKNEWDMAYYYLNKSFTIAKSLPDKPTQASSLARLITIYAIKKENIDVKNLSNQINEIEDKYWQYNWNNLGIAYLGLARIVLNSWSYDKIGDVIEYLKKGIEYVSNYGSYTRMDIKNRLKYFHSDFLKGNPEIIRRIGSELFNYFYELEEEIEEYSAVTDIVYKWMSWDRAGEFGQIIIGVSCPMKRGLYEYGIQRYIGSKCYINYINTHGGINGKKIFLAVKDDSISHVRTLKNTIEFSKNEDILLLFNYVGTPSVSLILDYLLKIKKKNIKLLFPFTGSPEFRSSKYNELIYHLRPSYMGEAERVAEALVANNLLNIGILYHNTKYGRSCLSCLEKALNKKGIKIIEKVTCRTQLKYNESLKNQISRLKLQKIDAIITAVTYEPCAAFIREARQNGLNAVIYNLSPVGSELLLNYLLKLGKHDSCDYTKDILNIDAFPCLNNSKFPAVKEYKKLINITTKNHFDEFIDRRFHNQISFEGFLNAKLLVEILMRMPKALKRDDISNTIEHLVNYDIGIDELISYGKNNNQGLHSIYISTFKDKKAVEFKNF